VKIHLVEQNHVAGVEDRPHDAALACNLFDDLMLHQTGSDPSMPNPRYAIESWFFGLSGFPADYVPIAC
jgi:hypothetical protein